jgi:hypothetical protein
MSVREIPEAHWQEFLEGFSRGHRAWLATVDCVPPGRLDAVERRLASVTPETRADRVVAIDIRFHDEAREAIRIDGLAKIRVDETSEGTVQELEIVDAEGNRTRIRFRSAPSPEMLDGIAPGELQT